MSRDEKEGREPGEETPESAGAPPPEQPPAAPASPPPSLPARREAKARTFRELWRDALPIIKTLIPQHVEPERLFALALTARQRSDKLMACTELSIMRGVIQAAQLGLDVSGVGGMAYLVPYFNNRTRTYEAQMQLGYKGLIDLARRGGRVLFIRDREVYQKEEFDYSDGLQPVLLHKPWIGAEDPGELVGAWATAVLPDAHGRPAGIQLEVMSAAQIEKVRKSSKAGDDSPWVHHTPMMYRKTVIKRLCRTLPQDRDLAAALDIEERAETGQLHDIDLELEGLAEAPAEAPTRTSEVKEVVKATAAKRKGKG